jgi:phosphate transport system protein
MPVHLTRETERLKKMVLALAAEVEENLRNAVQATTQRDQALAYRAIENDGAIDLHEVEVEEECLKILALHQPVAHDLRYIVAIMKINRDLERIGDLAVSIAERALQIMSAPQPRTTFQLERMFELVQQMVKTSLDALINRDADAARELWFSGDDEIDRMMAEAFQQVETEIRDKPENIATLVSLLSVTRALERIGDHATNIAKDTLYMIEGGIVRHRKREYRARYEARES